MTRARAKSYQHIIKYTGVFGSVEVLKILIGLIRNKLVAVILGPDGMGLISLFNSTIKLLSDTTGLGIPTSAVREISTASESEDRDRLEKTVSLVRSLSLLTAVVGMVLCASLCSILNKLTFTWGDHTLHFVLLSPVVGLTAILGGELAILKGIKELKALARLSVYGVLVALLVSVPMFYLWGEAAIVPVLILTELIQCVLVMNCSYRRVPLRLSPQKGFMSQARGMITLGLSFVVAGSLSSGADFFIRSYLNYVGSPGLVGLFNAGFMIVCVYAGMVFSAMETDYFPRLSSVKQCGRELNMVVSEQIEVSVLLISPLLVLLMVFMPIIMPLLYTYEFSQVTVMVQVALLSLLFRAIYIPIEYISLARSKPMVFLFQEIIAAVLLVCCILGGYTVANLWGAGAGLTIAYLLEAIFVLIISRVVYGYILSLRALRYIFLYLLIGLVTYGVVTFVSGVLYWCVGILLIGFSMGYTFNVLRSNAMIMKVLNKKILHRKTHSSK